MVTETNMGAALSAAFVRREGITCACGFEVCIETPLTNMPLIRQIRWAWFAHMQETHPEQYANLRGINGRRAFRRGR